MADDSRHRKLHEDEHQAGGVDEIGEGTLLPQDPTDHASSHEEGGSDELNLDATQIGDGSVSNTEFQYLDGVTTDVADKDYVNDKVQGLDWQESVIEERNDPPSSPSTGDRYLIGESPTGVWDDDQGDGEYAEYIVEWDGSNWIYIEPNEGFTTWIEADNENRLYDDEYPNGDWILMSGTVNHGGLTGLGDDDHTQYLHLDGVDAPTPRSMGGNLDMGTHDIIDVGTVDGIDISEHDHDGDAPNIPNAGLENDSLTVGSSGILSGGGSVSLGGSTTISLSNSDITHDDISGGTADEAHHNAFIGLLDDSDSSIDPDGDYKIKIDTDGSIDATAGTNSITLSTNDSGIDHGSLSGLGDDDHDHYLLADGTRNMSGSLNMDGHLIDGVTDFTASGDVDVSSGNLFTRIENQTGTPSLTNGEMCFWEDTGEDQIWLVFRLNDQNHYVELTG